MTHTESLCPECLARVTAERVTDGDVVYLVTRCPEHGESRAAVWRGAPERTSWARTRTPFSTGDFHPDNPRGCPFDCGICTEHEQRTCTVLVEVTARCNLRCSFCFADSGRAPTDDPSLPALKAWFSSAMEQAGPNVTLQLSGGEPTVRDDLPAVVRVARDTGFSFLQLNTNGIRLGDAPDYARELAAAGLTSVFLQFDGVDDGVYRTLRGAPLLSQKLAAIEHCVGAGLGVVLVPTLVVGVNDHQVGAIIRLALERAPGVRGVHFQPVSFFGRHPQAPRDADRITLPELLRAIEEQTHGLMRAVDFGPPCCEHPWCSFHGTFLRQKDGSVAPLTRRDEPACRDAAAGAERTVSFVTRQWAAPPRSPRDEAVSPFDGFVEAHSARQFAVSAMAFQDVWTLDLDRLRGCCIHVLTPERRLVPFCAYNLTSADGTPLYRTPR